MTLRLLAAAAAGLAVVYLGLLVALLLARPRAALLREAARLLPDLLRLIARLARDHSLPRGVRVRLWLLLGYLALPIDLIPDVIPVIGYADDAIVAAVALRSVVRRAGAEALERHWTGTEEGLKVVRRLAGLPAEAPPGA